MGGSNFIHFINACMKEEYQRAIAFCVIVIAFLGVLYGIRVLQDQQSLILAYEESERANTQTMYCVYTPDTLTK